MGVQSNLNDTGLLINFFIAAGLGALVGLERERYFESKERESFAGVRTFSIACLFGSLTGYLNTQIGPWIVVVGALAVTGVSITSIIWAIKRGDEDLGVTTELAFIVVYFIGAIIVVASRPMGTALGIGLAVLLALKSITRKWSAQVTREDISATLKFGIISCIILPFLPKETFDPYEVLSLYNIWLMVVLVSAISFSGYIATKFFGGHKGLGLTALFGGLWSSTATTMTFSARCKRRPEMTGAYALGALIACSTMFPRQIVEVYLVGPKMILPVLIPLGFMGILGIGISAIWYFRTSRDKEHEVDMTNPFRLTPALKFALLYASVLFVSKAASVEFGSGGVYAAALLTGLVDVNAITLSVANLVSQDKMAIDVGTKAVVIAAASNTVIKGGITLLFGSPAMFKRVMPWFVVILLVGVIAMIVFAPVMFQ